MGVEKLIDGMPNPNREERGSHWELHALTYIDIMEFASFADYLFYDKPLRYGIVNEIYKRRRSCCE